MLGNDIVSLNYADSPNYQHIRHLARMCSAEEMDFVRNAEDPSVAAAIIWAAKEAAFKLYAREQCLLFVPRQFFVRLNRRWQLGQNAYAVVEYRGKPACVELSLTSAWVHAVAISSNVRVTRWLVRSTSECFIGGPQVQSESAAVRILARELISQYFAENVHLSFHGRVPTLVDGGGNPVGAGISLSHHGDFAAAALAWTLNDAGDRRLRSKNCSDATVPFLEEQCSICMA